MKFTIKAKDLSEALQRVRSVVGSRHSLPILGSVLLEAKDGAVHVTGSNLEQRLAIRAAAAVEAEGSVALPHGRLSLAATALSGNIAVNTDAKHVTTLTASGSTIRLHGLPAADFPPADSVKGESVALEFPGFVALLKKAEPFMSVPAHMRPSIEGVLLVESGKLLTMVATDGRRMIAIRTSIGMSKGTLLTLPANAVRALIGLEADVATTFVGNNAIQFQSENWTLQTKVIEEAFPAWEAIMPDVKEMKVAVVIDRLEALDALSITGITATDKAHKLAVTANGEVVRFETETPDVGKSSVAMPRKEKGAPLHFGINPKFFADAIRICDEPDVTIRGIDGLSPIVIQEANFTTVTMPMRVQ